MKFPFPIAEHKEKIGLKRWELQFADHPIQETIWRRNQIKENKEESGWKSNKDARLRILHFKEKYSVKNKDNKTVLFVDGTYLHLVHGLPKKEALQVFKNYSNLLSKNNFIRNVSNKKEIYKKPNIGIILSLIDSQHEIQKLINNLPTNYCLVDTVIKLGQIQITQEDLEKPWKALKSGIRKKDERGKPKYSSSIALLKKYLPCQIDLGCGPSEELGIPPINYLYDIFNVRDLKTNKMVFGIKDKFFENFLMDQESFLIKTSKIIAKSWTAEPKNSFYDFLKRGIKKKIFLEPIITNNYDNILKLNKIKVEKIRKFTEEKTTFKFDKKAKSLLVIGVHSDRRHIHKDARSKGLKVFYVDPEVYIDAQNKKFDYPLESPQDSDIIYKMTANEFAKKFKLI
jgi:hypothetical protein